MIPGCVDAPEAGADGARGEPHREERSLQQRRWGVAADRVRRDVEAMEKPVTYFV